MSATLRAAFWMLGAIVSFSLMAVAGRAAGAEHDTFEIMMYRSMVGVVIVSVVLSLRGGWAQVSTRALPMHILRNAAHFIGQNLWLYAVLLIPLAQVFALEFTTPLWVIVLSPLVLGERLTRWRALAALVGFVGVLIVSRPAPDTFSIGLAAAASCAIFFAMTTMLTKRLTRTQSTGDILFWLTVTQLVFGAVCAGYDGEIALPSQTGLPWLVAIGLAGLMAHFCITSALMIAPATVVIPFDFARLPTIAVVGWLIYGEEVDIWVMVGAAVIFAGIYLNILAETRMKRVGAG